MTPIPGHRPAPTPGRGGKLHLLYLRRDVATPARCPCWLVDECRKADGPVRCEGDAEAEIGLEKVRVRL